MAEEHDARFDDLLMRALDAPEGEVDAVLDACADAELRRAVRELLGQEGGLGDFLEPPVMPPVLPTSSRAAKPSGSRSDSDTAVQATASLMPTLATHAALGGLRERLRRVGWGMALLCACLTSIRLVTPNLAGGSLALDVEATLAGSMLLLSLILAVSAAERRLSDRNVVLIAHVFLFAVCGLLGLFHGVHEIRIYGTITPFGPYSLAIGLFPLVGTTGLAHSLVTATAAAAAAGAGILASLALTPDAPAIDSLSGELVLGIALGIFIAGILARNLDRMRAKMDEIRQLGSYRLESRIGKGGMGEVWRATHHLLARPTAIKLVRPEHLGGLPENRQNLLERFTREARATASLGSVHTVDLYDFGVTDEGTFFIAMDLLDGIDLRSLVKGFGPQNPERVRRLLIQACDSLAEAHDKGLIHRDIKPANLMLCRQGRQVDVLKVLDFGIVALARRAEDLELTNTGAVLGTPAFLAPEALERPQPDPRSDLYSLGCVAYYLLTGRHVFTHQSRAQLVAAHLRDPPTPPSEHGVELPEDLEAIVLRSLAKDPDARFATADELARRLEAGSQPEAWSDRQAREWWQEHLPEATERPQPPDGRPRRAEITQATTRRG